MNETTVINELMKAPAKAVPTKKEEKKGETRQKQNQVLVRFDENLDGKVDSTLKQMPGVTPPEFFRQAAQFAIDNLDAFIAGSPVQFMPDLTAPLHSAPSAVLERKNPAKLQAMRDELHAATQKVFADPQATKVSHQLAAVSQMLANMIVEAGS